MRLAADVALTWEVMAWVIMESRVFAVSSSVVMRLNWEQKETRMLLFLCCSADATAPMMLRLGGTAAAPEKDVGDDVELRRVL